MIFMLCKMILYFISFQNFNLAAPATANAGVAATSATCKKLKLFCTKICNN